MEITIQINDTYRAAPIAVVAGQPNASRVVELSGDSREQAIAAAILEGGIAGLNHKIAWSCHLLLTSTDHADRHETAREWLRKLGVSEYAARKTTERDGRLVSIEYPGGVLSHQNL